MKADGNRLRFYDPASQRRLPTSLEACQQKDAELERRRQGLAALQRRNWSSRSARVIHGPVVTPSVSENEATSDPR